MARICARRGYHTTQLAQCCNKAVYTRVVAAVSRIAPLGAFLARRSRPEVLSSARFQNCSVTMYQPADAGFASYFLAMLADQDRNVQYGRAIQACIAAFKEKERRAPVVLDLGCGTGLLTRLALLHGAQKVVGVDTNKTMVSLATRALKAAGVSSESYELFHGTVENYILNKDLKFDILVSEILGTLHTSENLPEYAQQASRYLRTFDDNETYCVPQVAATYLRTAIVKDDEGLPTVLQSYGRELLAQCTAAPSWTPTNELGAYFLDRVEVGPRVEVRTDSFTTLPFAKNEGLRKAQALTWSASQGVPLVVLEFECKLWGDILLKNTVDEVRTLSSQIGGAEALGRYDAWGFFVASVPREATAKLTSYSANGLPALRLGASTVSAEVNEVSGRHAVELRALADYTQPPDNGEKWLCDRDAPRALALHAAGADVVLYEPDAVCCRLAKRQAPSLRTASTSRRGLSDDRDSACVQDHARADEVLTGASQSAAVRALGLEGSVKWPVVTLDVATRRIPFAALAAKWSPGAPEPILVGCEAIVPQCDAAKELQRTLRCDDGGAHWCLDLLEDPTPPGVPEGWSLGGRRVGLPADRGGGFGVVRDISDCVCEVTVTGPDGSESVVTCPVGELTPADAATGRTFLCARVVRQGAARDDLAARHARCQAFGPRVLDVSALTSDTAWTAAGDASKGTVALRGNGALVVDDAQRAWLSVSEEPPRKKARTERASTGGKITDKKALEAKMTADGWTKEEKKREGSDHVDKYWIDPAGGKKCRSTVEVARRAYPEFLSEAAK